MMCHSSTTSAAKTAAMTPAAAAPARETTQSSLRRSNRSATAPDNGPRKKNGAMPNADATPTMNADSVISKMSQPDTTQFMPIDADWISTAHHRSRKSRNSNERDQPPRTAVRLNSSSLQSAPTATAHSSDSGAR